MEGYGKRGQKKDKRCLCWYRKALLKIAVRTSDIINNYLYHQNYLVFP
jgi:hypothetical protein